MPGDFAALHGEELRDIAAPGDGGSLEYGDGAGGAEPYVRDTPHDLVGLCLSGGGIRSATFNLGVLQALARLGVLEQFDYLSTVSGGGYVGSWWTRMRQRRGTKFPDDLPEAPEVRHLREFSNFLSPRVGVGQTETWNFVVALVAAMVPSLVAAAAALVLVLWGADAAAGVLRSAAAGDANLVAVAYGSATIAVLFAAELAWRRSRRAAPADQGTLLYFVSAAVGTACAVWTWRECLRLPWAAALGWLAACGVLAVLRFLASRAIVTHRDRVQRAALDRVTGRMLQLAAAAVAFGLVWRLGGWLHRQTGPVFSWTLPGGASVATVALWVVKSFSAEPSKARTGGVGETLRGFAPQVLAWTVIVAAAASVAALLQSGLLPGDPFWLVPGAAAAALLVVMVFFDPAEVGLHAAYRSRIARAYLGEAGAQGRSRCSDETGGDDVPMSALAMSADGGDAPKRPVHLVCCAANDLAGDPLPILGRGARSATLSRHGFAVDGAFRAWTGASREPTLAGAVTASAAAFNTAMGAASARFGPGVSFLMAALDLRLGLWLPHPADGTRLEAGLFRGGWFLREMASRIVVAPGRGVHLSDGGHFENLGLYELVRRHVRYVVVCDCGQDVDLAFDDVGNAIRRVRADFGVEITVDLAAMRRDGADVSRSHVAVGDIVYPQGDRGVLVLIKPNMTGDEPNDVIQYRARNADFPDESTADQFYDAAQWESYRRLGVHAAETAFSKCVRAHPDAPGGRRIEFGLLRQEWYPTPPDFDAAQLALSARCHEIETALRADAPPALIRQVYPEITWAGGSGAIAPGEWPRVVEILQQVIQLMEDVWMGCRLERFPGHPANVGWMNWFQRWASTPAFRTLWPVLRPMWSAQMRRFFEPRFDLERVVDLAEVGEVVRAPESEGPGDGTARALWSRRRETAPQGIWYELWLRLEDGRERRRVQVALARLSRGADPSTLLLRPEDFYVVPGFWGVGIGSWFLDAIVRAIRRDDPSARRIEVRLPAEETPDAAIRQERSDEEQFYARAGFRADGAGATLLGFAAAANPRVLRLALDGGERPAAPAAEKAAST